MGDLIDLSQAGDGEASREDIVRGGMEAAEREAEAILGGRTRA